MTLPSPITLGLDDMGRIITIEGTRGTYRDSSLLAEEKPTLNVNVVWERFEGILWKHEGILWMEEADGATDAQRKALADLWNDSHSIIEHMLDGTQRMRRQISDTGDRPAIEKLFYWKGAKAGRHSPSSDQKFDFWPLTCQIARCLEGPLKNMVSSSEDAYARGYLKFGLNDRNWPVVLSANVLFGSEPVLIRGPGDFHVKIIFNFVRDSSQGPAQKGPRLEMICSFSHPPDIDPQFLSGVRTILGYFQDVVTRLPVNPRLEKPRVPETRKPPFWKRIFSK